MGGREGTAQNAKKKHRTNSENGAGAELREEEEEGRREGRSREGGRQGGREGTVLPGLARPHTGPPHPPEEPKVPPSARKEPKSREHHQQCCSGSRDTAQGRHCQLQAGHRGHGDTRGAA